MTKQLFKRGERMRYLLVILFFSLSTPVWAEDIDQTLPADEGGEIKIDIVSGDVRVIGWNKAEVRVKGELPKNKDDFVFKVNGNKTRIELEPKHSFWNSSNGAATLEIHVPQYSSIKAEGASTTFEIEKVLGSIDVSSMSGDLTLEGGNDNIELEAVSGNITVQGATGQLNLSSVSGDVTVDANANYFEAQTVSGDIEANIGSAEKIELESVSGDINVSLLIDDNGRLDAGTVSGDIEIEFQNDDINARFDIETGPGGDFRNKISEDRMDEKNRFSSSVEFSLGKGGASVEIETMSGTIELER